MESSTIRNTGSPEHSKSQNKVKYGLYEKNFYFMVIHSNALALYNKPGKCPASPWTLG
jgi:hypothetical protein